MRPILAITKALSDINRIRILCALHERGELCVCQIQEMLGLAASSTSRHLSLLSAAGLVDGRKEGRWAYYSIAEGGAIPANGVSPLEWLLAEAALMRQIAADRLRLKQILALSPEELCQMQASGKRCCSSAPETPVAAKSPKASRGRSTAN